MMKRVLIPVTILMLLSFTLQARQVEVVHEVKTYKSVGQQELKVDIFYAPEKLKGTVNPAIALFHGGGWAFGSPSEFYSTCKRFAEKGFVTFSFSYRLSIKDDGTFPHPQITPVESTKDARSALRWLKENATELKIDPDMIVAGGQSAGGQLALSTVLVDNVNESTDNMTIDPSPCALLLFSSNVNTVEAWVDRLLGDRRDEIWSISPYHNLKPGMPPAIEFHGTEDPQVPYWVVEYFMFRTRELGNHFEQIKFEGKKHYLAEGDDTYATYYDETVLERVDTFLVEQGLMPRNQ